MKEKLKKKTIGLKSYWSDSSRAIWDMFPVYPPENKEKIIKLQELLKQAHWDMEEKLRTKYFKTFQEAEDYREKNFWEVETIYQELKKLYAEHDRLKAQYEKEGNQHGS